MTALGAALLAASGLLAGVTGVRALQRQSYRAGTLLRLLLLIRFELERFRIPFPVMFSSLTDRTEGAAKELCERAALILRAEDIRFRDAWTYACGSLSRQERDIMLPLGEVLGRYGAEEQLAALSAAEARMREYADGLRGSMGENSRLWLGLCSACGLLAAVLLL